MNRLVIGLGVVFAACDARVPLESYCQERALADCEYRKACGWFSAQVDCKRIEPAGDCLGPFRAELAARVLTYDEVAAAQCNEEVRKAECETGRWLDPLSLSGPCSTVFTGRAVENESCGVCAPGFGCLALEVGACGACVPITRQPLAPLPSEGEACSSPAVDGLGCKLGFWCVDGLCERAPRVGEACGQQPCIQGSGCVNGLCVEKPDLGESCTNLSCKEGLFCSSATICVALRQIGANCETREQCSSFICVDGSCARRRGEGMSCSTEAGCEFGLWCVDAECVRLPETGAACVQGRPCSGQGECIEGRCFDRRLECR